MHSHLCSVVDVVASVAAVVVDAVDVAVGSVVESKDMFVGNAGVAVAVEKNAHRYYHTWALDIAGVGVSAASTLSLDHLQTDAAVEPIHHHCH